MENYDSGKAAQIWQRVHPSPPENDTGNLLGLIAEEWTDAAIYLRLSRQFQGREAQLLRRLYEEEQAHAACLKGIYTLTTGERAPVHTPAAPQEPVEVTLRRCYGREMRCLAQYEKRIDHREYGPVFARLADQEQEHCKLVLILLGRLKHTK